MAGETYRKGFSSNPSPSCQIVCRRLLVQFRHNGVRGIDLHRLLGNHVRSHRVLSSCAYMTRSMLADQPCSDVVRTHGESTILLLTITFSTLSPSTSFINFVNGSNSAFSSSCFSSHPLTNIQPLHCCGFQLLSVEFLDLLHCMFIHGVQDTTAMLSPVM